MQPPKAPPLLIDQHVGPYRVLEKLGEGGMGQVYRAHDTRLNRDVALKVLPAMFVDDPERLERFTREAKVLASLNHPHIAQIYGIEDTPGGPAIVMELVDGRTLAEAIAAHDLPDVLPIASQIAESLAVAHAQGIVHRDLKPANIKIRSDGEVKVLDFGLARTFPRDGAGAASADDAGSPTMTSPARTEAGVILGTAAYMSPEQARGLVVDKRADVWAFGCVLYEMLTGRQAFAGRTVSDTITSIMRDQPDWSLLPRTTPPVVQWLIERCLEKDARTRLQDLGDARLILDDHQRLSRTSGSEAATPPSPERRARAGLAAAGLFALGLVATGSIAVQHWRETPSESKPFEFAIVPAEGMEFPAPGQMQVAVSPDGRYIAFTMAAGRTTSLWLRPVDSVTARPLTGTEGASLPFWSPDSRSIAYFTAGSLQAIRIDGGPPKVICPVATGRGGSWSREGVIVFAPAADAPLLQVSDAGGTPAPVTTLDPPRENSHRMPWFLPDGRHFLFLSGGQATAGGIGWQIKVGSLDSRDTVKVVDAELGSSPIFSADHLLFTRNSSLVALRFDPATLEPSGVPIGVGNQSFSSTSASRAAFSASSDGLLAFMAAADRQSRLGWIDRSGRPGELVGAAGIHNGMALSPDGGRAAVSQDTGPPFQRDIWIVDLGSGARSRLTVDPASEDTPVWSHDGAAVYFSSSRSGAANLFRRPVDASSPEELLRPSDRSQRPTDVSPDGGTLVFTQVTETGTDVWAMSLSGDRRAWPLVEGASAKEFASISPDGRWLAYQSNESGRAEVYVRSFHDGGTSRRVSTNGGTEPVWRSDGRELFFMAGDSLVALPVTEGGPGAAGLAQGLYTLPSATGQTAAGSVSRRYAASADGRRFLTFVDEGTTAQRLLTVVTNWRSTVR